MRAASADGIAVMELKYAHCPVCGPLRDIARVQRFRHRKSGGRRMYAPFSGDVEDVQLEAYSHRSIEVETDVFLSSG